MIIDNENYSLTGSQVKDVAGRIKANHDSIGDLGSALGTKQDALTTAQLAAVDSGIDSTKVGQITTNANDIDAIEGKIPAQATSSNQLADKSFVTDAVQTNSAHFRGNWATWNDVPTDPTEYPIDDDGNHTPTSNDYMVVQDASGFPTSPDPALEGTWRFKYSGVWDTNGKNGWHPEYQVNETPLTSDQLAALNSGITAEAVTKLGGIEAGAEVNDIDSISVNGTAVTPDANKNVALTIPPESIKTLTTDDYNWPTSGTATCVALWLLDRGLYKIGDNVSYMPFKLTNAYTGDGKIVYSVGPSRSNHKVVMSLATTPPTIYYPHFSSGDASGYLAENSGELMTFNSILNLLDSTSTTHALSAAQGKYLNDNKADKTAFTGTDGTAAGTMGLVPAPATTDAGKVLGADGAWTGLPEGVKTLTTADYNYPATGTKTAFDVSLSDTGFYQTGEQMQIKVGGITSGTPAGIAFLVLKNTNSDGQVNVIWSPSTYSRLRIDTINPSSSPTTARLMGILQASDIVDSLTGQSTVKPLSANQGRILNNNIGDLTTLTTTAKTSAVSAINELDSDLAKTQALSGSGAPTTSTVGAVGQFYVDTTTGDIYYLSAIVPGTDPDPDTYTWNKVATGSGVNIVQTTGTSTTDVMSQDAVTEEINKRGIKLLTTEDYNWPESGTKLSIALWKLAPGYYRTNGDDVLYYTKSSTSGLNGMSKTLIIVGQHAAPIISSVLLLGKEAALFEYTSAGVLATKPQTAEENMILRGVNVVDDLTTNSSNNPLSAAQGKILNDTKATITMTTTDPGEGASIGANELIGVYQ